MDNVVKAVPIGWDIGNGHLKVCNDICRRLGVIERNCVKGLKGGKSIVGWISGVEVSSTDKMENVLLFTSVLVLCI